MTTQKDPFQELVTILARLRGPGGCPWDQEQTYKDINPYMLEEAHEILEAIDNNDFNSLKEELGDLLVHIFFHAQLATEEKRFTIQDVVTTANEKLIRRHPHVFGDDKSTTTKEVLANWEKIKQKENKGKRESVLEGIPKSLSALIRSLRLGEKSSRVGFDWPDQEGILKKVEEEEKELKQALTNKNPEEIENEYGDLLFTLANLARFLKIDPETALRKSADRFTKRFQWIEKEAKAKGETLQDFSPEKWDALWNEAKKK